MTPKSPIEALEAILNDPKTPPSIRLIAARGLDAQVPPVIDLATITPDSLIQHWQEHRIGKASAE